MSGDRIDDVLAVFEGEDWCEPFNARQVADRLDTDVHRNTARNYLEDLVSVGEIASKKVGPSRVYWRPCKNYEGHEV